MARKKKPAQKKVSTKVKPVEVNDSEKAFLNFVNKNAQQNSGFNEFNGGSGGVRKVSSESESSSSHSSSSGSDAPFHGAVGSEKLASGNGIQKVSVNRGRPPKKQKVSKQVANEKTMLTKVLSSSGVKGKQPDRACQHPGYNNEELEAALTVIKKVMEMDEAAAFRAPVDPISLPDYFAVVDTPMDFGTICSNIQNGVKYLTAQDVYKDVQYIWKNCLLYNKKGDYVVYLMKRVQKKFMKYWTAAGLKNETIGENSGYPDVIPSDDAVKFSQKDVISIVSRMLGNLVHMKDNTDIVQPQSQISLSSDSEPTQFHKPQPSTNKRHLAHEPQPIINHPYEPQKAQSSINKLYPSNKPQLSTNPSTPVPQLEVGTNSNYAGDPRLFHSNHHTVRQSKHVATAMLDSSTGIHTQQNKMVNNQPLSQVSLPSYCQPYPLHQPQLTAGQPSQPSQLQGGLDSNCAGRSDLIPSKVRTMKRSRRNAVSTKDSTVQQSGLHNIQPQCQVPLSSGIQPYHSHQSEGNINQPPQISQLHADTNSGFTDCSELPLPVMHIMKQKKYKTRSSVISMTSSPTNSKQQQPQPRADYLQQSPQRTFQPPPINPHTSEAHLHLLPSEVPGMRVDGFVPRSPVDPIVVNVNELEPQQPSLSTCQSSESPLPPSSTGHIQSSRLLPCADRAGLSSMRDANPTNIEGKHEWSSPMDIDSERPLLSNHTPSQPPSGSHSYPDQSKQTTSKRKNRPRGPTFCRKLWEMPEGERVFVAINRLGQPIGSEASLFSTFLGTIARNGEMCPLIYPDWFSMPEEYRENMWRFVQSKFDVNPLCKSWVLKNISSRWKNWKAKLKSDHYYPHKTDEERLNDRDERVLPDQWPVLISYWNSEDVQLRCATNRANRARQKTNHTAGRKSYARIREEERTKRPDGKEPTRAELYIMTRTRKDGRPLNEAAAETIAKLREQESQNQLNPDSRSGWDDALAKVLGEEKSSSLHMYGLGPSPTDLWGRKPANSEIIKVALEAQKTANEQVGKVIEKMGTMEQKYAVMEDQIARMTSSMQNFFEKMGGMNEALGTKQERDGHSSSSHAGSSNEINRRIKSKSCMNVVSMEKPQTQIASEESDG